MSHVTEDELRTFSIRGHHPRLIKHLLDGCEECHRFASSFYDGTEIGEKVLELQRVSTLIRREIGKASVTWARLAPLPLKTKVQLLRNTGRFKKYGLAVFVLDEAEALLGARNPVKAGELVAFSMAITDCLRERTYGAAALADLRLRQYTTLANLHRIEQDFMSALEALQKAEDIRGSGIDPAEEARFLRVQAGLLHDLGEFELAARAARDSACLYEAIEDRHSHGKALLHEAMILAQFEPETGLSRAEEGLSRLNPTDSHPYLTGILNRALCLVQLGRPEEAHDSLSQHREIIREVASPALKLLFLWLDAKILRSRREYREAEEILGYLALRFSEEQMHQEMLLVHMDRIEIKVETQRWKSALNIARSLTPELTRLGLRNDLLSMWATLQDALSGKQAVARQIRDYFLRRWKTPARR